MEIPWEYQIKKQDKQLLQLLIDAILYYGHMKHKELYNMLWNSIAVVLPGHKAGSLHILVDSGRI